MGFYPRAHRSTVCSGARCTRCTFMEAFSIKINTEGCLVFSLSLFLSSPSSIPVLSQFRRWLDVVYRSRCLFLSYLRKIVFSFFFFFFLSLSLSLCLVFGWSLCLFSLLLHTRFFLLFCFVSYSFFSFFLLSFSPFR